MKAVLHFAMLVVIGTASMCGAQHVQMAGPSMGGLGQLPGVSFGRPQVRVGFGARPLLPRFPRTIGVPIFFGYDEPTSVIVENVVPSLNEEEVQRKPVFEEHVPEPPLILEKQGDQWVRRTADQYGPSPETDQAQAGQKNALKPTTLVFRDGQRIDVLRYIISGQTLYENTEHWTRRIQIADLDLPATIRLNRQRGIAFRVPHDSNEVITRP